jgi:hypothetical protein
LIVESVASGIITVAVENPHATLSTLHYQLI